MDELMTGSKRRRHASSARHQQLNHLADGTEGGAGPHQYRGASENASVTSESSKAKKRFVWPDDLHRDFVAAIFDVGLKCASPKTIMEMMSNTKELTPDHIKSHLQKYRLHRERAREEFLQHFGKNPFVAGAAGTGLVCAKGEAGGVSRDGSASSLDSVNGIGGRAEMDHQGDEDAFRGQLNLIRDCIQMQAGFQSVLRQALMQQTQLQQQLQAHLQALGFDGPSARMAAAAGAREALGSAAVPSSPSAGPLSIPVTAEGKAGGSDEAQYHYQYEGHSQGQPHSPAKAHVNQQQQAQVRRPNTGSGGHMSLPGGGKRSAEELMQEEMREHMDMHRQLVLRKNAQISQYEDGAKMAAAAAAAVQGLSGGPVSGAGLPASYLGVSGGGGNGMAHPGMTENVPVAPHLPASASVASSGMGLAGPTPVAPGGMITGGHPGLDLEVDLASFRWNEDEDNLFSFLMDHPVG